MATRTDEYWAKRAVSVLTQIERHSIEYLDQVAKLLTSARKQIEADIARILSKYIEDSGLGADEAKELLTAKQSREWLDELRQRLGAVKDPKARRMILNQLNAPAYRARITRLQAINAAVETTLRQIAPMQVAAVEESLAQTVDEAFYRTIFEMQRGLNAAFSFDAINADQVHAVLSERWSGALFSERIWKNTEITAELAKEIIRTNVTTGRSWRRCKTELQELVDTSGCGASFAAERLLRTETNRAHNEATALAHEAAGVEKYRFLATLDARTSEVCQEHDGIIDPDTGEEYLLKNRKVGVNYPPLHPNCRSTTTPRIDPELEAVMVRTARDPETGEIMTVPLNMTYKEWKKGSRGSGAIRGSAGGALDPDSERAEVHAEMYYKSVRTRKGDIEKISKNTGFTPEEIQGVRDYLFIDKHDLGDVAPRRFDADYRIAESWRRLCDGQDIQSHDLTLLRHEIEERRLVKLGMSQYNAHMEASKLHDYKTEVDEYYASLKKDRS